MNHPETYNTYQTSPKKTTAYLTTYGIWLGTAALAVYEIALVRNLVITIYAWIISLTSRNPQLRTTFEGVVLGQWVTILMAIVAIAVVIGGFEYHHRRVGEPKSLKILAWTLGIQLSVLLLGLVI